MSWQAVGNFEDILYEKQKGVAKVTINRPEKRNAFRPKTVSEMYEAFLDAREDSTIGVILLTGAVLILMGSMHSVRGEIKVCAERRAMSEMMVCPGSTYLICKS